MEKYDCEKSDLTFSPTLLSLSFSFTIRFLERAILSRRRCVVEILFPRRLDADLVSKDGSSGGSRGGYDEIYREPEQTGRRGITNGPPRDSDGHSLHQNRQLATVRFTSPALSNLRPSKVDGGDWKCAQPCVHSSVLAQLARISPYVTDRPFARHSPELHF